MDPLDSPSDGPGGAPRGGPGAESDVERLLVLFESTTRDHAAPAGSGAGDPARAREVLDSVLDEMLGGAEAEPPRPDFPGYTVLGEAGRGGFGVVYRARDEKLGREVALKLLLPRLGAGESARSRFLAEARALARVRHPNVLAIHNVLEHEGRIALVTEFIEGEPLSDLVQARGPLGAAEAARVGAELCRALAAAHAAGIVHRDVKTPNIFRERGGRIVLGDFGLGVFLAEGRDLERAGLVAGSPLFMAPEVVAGEPADARSDLYAAGIVLYHLATGKFPVAARDLRDLFRKIRAGELTPLRDARPDLPEGFVRVVAKATAARPEDRYRSAGEMEAALLGFLGEAPAAPLRPRGARASLAAGVLAALAAVALLLFAPSLHREPRHFHVEAEFRLETPGGGSRPLAAGDPVELGSQVFLEVKADQPVHAYVLNESERGERLVLFPLPSGGLQNPLAAGARHRLPGPAEGGQKSWRLSTTAGDEHLLVVAAIEPVEAIERILRAAGAKAAGGAFAYPTLPEADARDVVRGFGELAPQRAAKSASGGEAILSRLAEDLAGGLAAARGVWMRKLTLRNP